MDDDIDTCDNCGCAGYIDGEGLCEDCADEIYGGD